MRNKMSLKKHFMFHQYLMCMVNYLATLETSNKLLSCLGTAEIYQIHILFNKYNLFKVHRWNKYIYIIISNIDIYITSVNKGPFTIGALCDRQMKIVIVN